jgi:small-conductance mechanosensitive channel
MVLVDDVLVFLLVDADTDATRGETLDALTRTTVTALEEVVAATRESRDHQRLGRAIGLALLASAAFYVAWRLVLRGARASMRRLAASLGEVDERIRMGGVEVISRQQLHGAGRVAVRLCSGGLLLVLAHVWLGAVLGAFPYTRPWALQLDRFLLGVAHRLGDSALRAIPDLVTAAAIFGLAWAALALLAPIFDRVEAGAAGTGWLDRDTVRPTRRLVAVAVWLFAIVMAYPYLPGSHSEAFRGMSVLVGLMVTIGGSSVIGQAASGLILMYSRTLRAGDYVRVLGVEGTVVALGPFTTRLRTGLGTEIALPNSQLLSGAIANYSRPAEGRGFVVDTTVTIGYDTPWRQVETLLVDAARRTPGLRVEPAPRVFQTALGDFYPEYRLVCRADADQPARRAEVISALHANIQDTFNEAGVQIMSPHYVEDPAAPKVVPRGSWFPAADTARGARAEPVRREGAVGRDGPAPG